MAINLNAVAKLFAPKAPQLDEVEALVDSFEQVKSLPAFQAVKENLRDKIEAERQAQTQEAAAAAVLRKAEQAEAMMGVILRRAKQAQLNTAAAKEAEAKAMSLAKETSNDVKILMSLMDKDLTEVDLDMLLGNAAPVAKATKAKAKAEAKVAPTVAPPAPAKTTQAPQAPQAPAPSVITQ